MDIEDRIKACQEPQELLALIAECHDYNTLFKVWKVYNEKKPLRNKINGKMVCEKSAFISDGVLRLPEDRHNKWDESSYPKVLFIIKDQYQDAKDNNNRGDEDIRDWLVWSDEKNPHRGEDNRNLKSIKKGNKNIFRPLGRWLMGVHAILEKDSFMALEDLSDEAVTDHISNYPMAIIECKKQPGGPRLESKVLKQYIERDQDFIKKEIELLDPDVIICCDKSGLIYKAIVSMLGGVCHNQNITKICNQTYVINSYHPSYSFYNHSNENNCYYYVINALWDCLHPGHLGQEKKLLQSVNPSIQQTLKELCDRVRDQTQSSDWNIWNNSLNNQKRIFPNEVEPRAGIEAYWDNDNYFRIYLAFWRGSGKWQKNPRISGRVKQLFTDLPTETLKWKAKGDFHEIEKNIGKPGVLLSEIKNVETNIEDIICELKKWHDIILGWLNTYSKID